MKNRKLPNIVLILILTLITVVVWVSFNIYRSITAKPASAVPKEVSQPITPTLDNDTLKIVESRIFLNDSEIPDNVVTSGLSGASAASPTPSPNIQEQETSSPSASPIP